MVEVIHPHLYALFRPSVQPYLYSWFQFNPVTELAKLDIPVLIVHGSTDIQVDQSEAKLLARASVNASSVVIQGMNHVLKVSPMERVENHKNV